MGSIVEAIQSAILSKKTLWNKFAQEKTDCYRLFAADSEIPGLVIDRLGKFLSFHLYESTFQQSESELSELAEHLGETLAVDSVYLRFFPKDRNSTVARNRLLWGKTLANREPVQENGITYWVEPLGGFSEGLFIDQRNGRQWLGSQVGVGDSFLNLFSYTCSFSVVAAKRECPSVSVDISRNYLDWGKENFTANGLSTEGHDFIKEDVREFLKRAHKKGRQFTHCLLDPPSFSRGKNGRVMSLKKDMPDLIAAASMVMAPQGKMLVCCNLSEWTVDDLKKCVVRAEMEKMPKIKKAPSLPEDFFPKKSALISVLLEY